MDFTTEDQGDQKVRKKSPNFSKSRPKSLQVNKGQNIYNKAQFESPKHLHQTTFETLKFLQQTMFLNFLFGWKCNKFALTKSSQKCHHYFGLLHRFKKSYRASKSSPIGKKSPDLVTLLRTNTATSLNRSIHELLRKWKGVNEGTDLSLVEHPGVPHSKTRLLSLPTNNRLGWKCLKRRMYLLVSP